MGCGASSSAGGVVEAGKPVSGSICPPCVLADDQTPVRSPVESFLSFSTAVHGGCLR
jgi:hypothetical protein